MSAPPPIGPARPSPGFPPGERPRPADRATEAARPHRGSSAGDAPGRGPSAPTGDATRLGTRLPHDPGRAVPALVAYAAVVAAAWPLSVLFAPGGWLVAVAVVGAVITLGGIALRAAGARPGVVLAVQAVLGVLAALAASGAPGLLFGVVPTPATLVGLGDVLARAGQTLVSSAPPVAADPGVTLLLALALGVVWWATDALAATLRLPALAGLPLLTPYLTAVANSDGSLPWVSFVLLAAGWLALLATGAPTADEAVTGLRARRLGRAAVAGGLALLVAVVAGAVIPRAPVRYLAGGYGAAGGGHGTVGYSPEADMLASLRSTDTDPVLRYTGDDPSHPPLRVGVTSTYRNGRWVAEPAHANVSSSPVVGGAGGIVAGPDRVSRTLQVEDNRLASPHLATAAAVVAGTVTGARWGVDPATGVVVVDRTPPRYRMSYLTLDPAREATQLRLSALENSAQFAAELDTSGVTDPVHAEAARVTAGADGAYQKAVALQRYFRDGSFTYDLDVPPPPAGMGEAEAAATAVQRFLTDRRGYCVQFTTAFVMMARSLGIPARMATGFLPGRTAGSGYEVLPSDAHAWPELHFAGVGWVRFEPTPGARSGDAPGYSTPLPTASPTPTRTPTATPTPTATRSATPTASPRASRESAEADAEPVEPAEAPGLGAWGRVLLIGAGVVLLLAAAAAVLPALAARRRRARLAATGDDRARVEARWADLHERLGDLALAPDPALPLPDQARRLGERAHLDDDALAAAGRLAATVQAARYAPPSATTPVWSADDARRVLRAARRSRPWRARLRAALRPRLPR